MAATLCSRESIEVGFRENRGDKGLAEISGHSFDFEISEEERYLLSCFPSELDFYDQKRGQILRPREKKQSLEAKATKKHPWKQSGGASTLSKQRDADKGSEDRKFKEEKGKKQNENKGPQKISSCKPRKKTL